MLKFSAMMCITLMPKEPIACMFEYKHVLISKKDIKCINMGYEYCLYTPYFGNNV